MYKQFICLVIIISVFTFKQVIAQDSVVTPMDNPSIQFISQWPSSTKKNKTTSVPDQIKKFILGSEAYKLSKPVALLVNSTDSLWILDQGNNTIARVLKETAKVPHFIEKKNINFPSLVDICEFTNNEILFTDSYLNKIYLVNAETKEIKVLNDSLKLNQPTGIAYSPITKEIWVTETGAHRIVVLNEKGEILKTIGSRGTGNKEFNFPSNICIDKLGNIYILDAMNFRVQVLNKEGDVISVFGTIGDGTGSFARPKGIATDSFGNIYITDALFHVVQVFNMKGNLLYYFGTQGHDEGQFWMPSGIYIDNKDYIYVADSYNARIQIFQLINTVKK